MHDLRGCGSLLDGLTPPTAALRYGTCSSGSVDGAVLASIPETGTARAGRLLNDSPRVSPERRRYLSVFCRSLTIVSSARLNNE